MVSGQMFSEQRFFAEGNVATDLGFMPHAERLLLQSDFVPSAEPSTHSGRRIAFAVSPHHFAPLFIGRERYGSGNSTLNYTTDVRNVGRAPDGEGGRYRSRPQNRNPISRSENFWQMAFCPRISESRLTTPNACSTFKGLPNVTVRCDVQLAKVMLQTSERPPFPAGKSLNSKIYRVAGALVALSHRAQDYGFNTTFIQPSSLSRNVR